MESSYTYSISKPLPENIGRIPRYERREVHDEQEDREVSSNAQGPVEYHHRLGGSMPASGDRAVLVPRCANYILKNHLNNLSKAN